MRTTDKNSGWRSDTEKVSKKTPKQLKDEVKRLDREKQEQVQGKQNKKIKVKKKPCDGLATCPGCTPPLAR